MRLFETKCIIQRDNVEKDKYYPKILSVNITETFPWTCPTVNVEIETNIGTGTAGYMSPVRVDDIVRIQVNTRSSDIEKAVWQDIFEGRIMSIESSFGIDNITTLTCRDHSEEALYRAVTADEIYSDQRTGAIIADMCTYLNRCTNDSLIDTTISTIISDFNIQQDTKYVTDIIKEMESLEAYTYIFKIVNSYDSFDNLSASVVSWQPVPALSKTVQIIEGTPRLLSASFSTSLENLVENVTIYGASGTPQKVGTSVDGSSAYNNRYHIGTDTSIGTDSMCSDLADATRSRFGTPIISGSVTILGSVEIEVGDLIYVKIPSIELSGTPLNANFRVKRLTHTINKTGWYTQLDLGELITTPSDILAGVHSKTRLLNAQFID